MSKVEDYVFLSNVPEYYLDHIRECAKICKMNIRIVRVAYDSKNAIIPNYCSLYIPRRYKETGCNKIAEFYELTSELSSAYKAKLKEIGYPVDECKENFFPLGCERIYFDE